VYNLARVRDAATSRYTRFQIPWEWMKQDTGIVSQVKTLHRISSLVQFAKIFEFRHCSIFVFI